MAHVDQEPVRQLFSDLIPLGVFHRDPAPDSLSILTQKELKDIVLSTDSAVMHAVVVLHIDD